jgi:hypothetical protein
MLVSVSRASDTEDKTQQQYTGMTLLQGNENMYNNHLSAL